jgi:hypothetical protein
MKGCGHELEVKSQLCKPYSRLACLLTWFWTSHTGSLDPARVPVWALLVLEMSNHRHHYSTK